METVIQFPKIKQPEGSASLILHELKQASAERRKAILTDFIRTQLVEFLELNAPEEVSDTQDFIELGADSMQAVDFKVKLETSLRCSLRSTLMFDYPRLDLLVEYLLNEVLAIPTAQEECPQATDRSANLPAAQGETIAIIAMAGCFPGAHNAEALWQKIISGEPLTLAKPNESRGMDFGRVEMGATAEIGILGLSETVVSVLDRSTQGLCKVIADALTTYAIELKQITKTQTGVYIAARDAEGDAELAYRIPLANKISFLLNLKGPSETVNTFCTSAYVALHRAVQSLQAGECAQAIVGGVNVVAESAFYQAAAKGLYDDFLSQHNRTESFSDRATGYVRSEGTGVILLKPLANALQDGNRILATVKSSAVFHGGRGYSYEAPNPPGLKETIKQCLEKAKLAADSIDYIEAHGIGNKIADALELNAIDQIYRQAAHGHAKQWHISCIKPSIGHLEAASGIASIIKVLKAFEHHVLPGIAGLHAVNSELSLDHALVVQAEHRPWSPSKHPRRAALNSYAIGGMNAHLVLEEYLPGTDSATPRIIGLKSLPGVSQAVEAYTDDALLCGLVKSIFNLDLTQLDLTLSLIDYGFDSIKVMQFITQLNETLGLNIKISQVLGLDSFAEFFELLAQQQLQKLPPDKPVDELPSALAAGAEVSSPLSEVQKGLWYVSELAPESIAFNVPITFKLLEPPQEPFLRLALNAMLQEYPLLRMNIQQSEEAGQILQKLRTVEVCQYFQSIRLADAEPVEAKLWDLLRQPFKLAHDPLLRLYRIESGVYGHYLFFVIHHIVFDGTSGALFIASFWEKYQTLAAGKTLRQIKPELAFFDFVVWEQAYLNDIAGQEDKNWWLAQLSGKSAALNLPYDRLPQASLSVAGIGCQKYTLDQSSLAALKQLAANCKTNLSVVLLTVFQILLSKLTQEADITVTTPVRGRPKQAFEKSMGCYINVMVIPGTVRSEQSFAELLQNTRAQFFACLDHANYPFPRILADLGLNLANPRENPFPVSYTYQNFFDEMLNSASAQRNVETLYDVFQQAEDHYTLEIYDFRETVQINFKYKRSLFDDATLARHLNYFKTLIANILAHPEAPIAKLELMDEYEKTRLLRDLNANHTVYPQTFCVHELFLQQALKTPDQPAVIYEAEQLSYRELNAQSDQLARFLQQQGVHPDQLVGVCLKRSPKMLVALLGILKAGGAYLPIDANTSVPRIQTLLQTSGSTFLITQAALLDALSEATRSLTGTLLVLDSDWDSITQCQTELRPQARPEHLAYVIYTSGSTGQPKGVMVEHRNLVNHNLAVIDAYRLTAQDRVLQFSTISFDIFVEEVFPTLLSGGAVVMLDGERYTDPDYFQASVRRHRVTLVNLPTAYWHSLVDIPFGDTALTRVIIGGEKAEMQKYQTWHATNPAIPVINTYGPTETTVIAALYPIDPTLDPECSIPLGTPLANTQLYVLDPGLNPVPIGVPGELHIAGRGVARGYLNQPDLTAEKFIANPFGSGKLYKTGDWVRWLADGNLEFIGRADDQVKIRGFRVELGEIERVLLKHPHIREAVVVAQQHSGAKQLIAYYQADHELPATDLNSFLRKTLPDYMLPAAWIRLTELPLNSSGKINRKLLQEQRIELSAETFYVAPTNAIENVLAEIWQEVLGLSQVGIQDNFFALGGHSLLAIQIVLRVNKQLAVNISLSNLFDATDIQRLAIIVAESLCVEQQDTFVRLCSAVGNLDFLMELALGLF